MTHDVLDFIFLVWLTHPRRMQLEMKGNQGVVWRLLMKKLIRFDFNTYFRSIIVVKEGKGWEKKDDDSDDEDEAAMVTGL